MLSTNTSVTNGNTPHARKGGRPHGSKPGNIQKDQVERILGLMLKSKDTPVQYKAGLASTLSTLKGWSKSLDADVRLDMGAHLRKWAAERIYASADGALVSSDALLAASEAGGIPRQETQTEALAPSHTPHTPENSAVTIENKEVSDG